MYHVVCSSTMSKERPVPPIYHEEGPDKGRVKNPNIAHAIAKVEDPYRRKVAGVFPLTEKGMRARIAKGEQAAEAHIARGQEIKRGELPKAVLTAVEEYERFAPESTCVGGAMFDFTVFRPAQYRRVDYREGKTQYVIFGRLDRCTFAGVQDKAKPRVKQKGTEPWEFRIQTQGDSVVEKMFGFIRTDEHGNDRFVEKA